VNVDGAFAADNNSGAIGAVARDDAGVFLMAVSRRLPVVASALAAEAEALRAGVHMIHTVTQGSVIMETDSLELAGYGITGRLRDHSLRLYSGTYRSCHLLSLPLM